MPQDFLKVLESPEYFWPCLTPEAQTYQDVRLLGRSLVECCRGWTALSSDIALDADLIRQAKIRGWYRALLRETGQSLPYAMTRRFNAETFKRYSSSWKGAATWDNYAKELHLPSPKTLGKVRRELKIPSEPELCFTLWFSLDVTEDIRGAGPHLVRAGLGHETRAVERALGLLVPTADRPETWELLGPSLLLRDSVRLETLGAMILLLRLAHTLNDNKKTSELAISLLEALSMLGIELHERGIAATVFGLCCSRIFPLAGLNKLTPLALAQTAALLNRKPWPVRGEDKTKQLDWAARLGGMQDYLADREKTTLRVAVEQFRTHH